MNPLFWIVVGLIVVFLALIAVIAAISGKPNTTRDQIIDDFMQVQSICEKDEVTTELLREYIKRDTNKTITSGCPVENNK